MERICKSAPEINGLSDARPWFQALLLTNNRQEPALVFAPKDLYKPKPPKFLPREKRLDHQTDWLRAIRNPSRPAGCNFDYSAPLAETVLLGNVAGRAGKGRTLLWDGQRITNDESANAFLRTTYRKGWEISG